MTRRFTFAEVRALGVLLRDEQTRGVRGARPRGVLRERATHDPTQLEAAGINARTADRLQTFGLVEHYPKPWGPWVRLTAKGKTAAIALEDGAQP